MADETNGGQATEQPQDQASLKIMAQYVKDLSFENPGAPGTLQNRSSAPKINISVGVQANPLSENDVEAELKIEASAVDGETIVFAIELVYAGIFRLTN
ncbi:MAG: protein-export chaperone SecB, partial [Alphaproteobacteria bacterium]